MIKNTIQIKYYLKKADWIIDIGPEGGNEGGHVVFEGSVKNLKKQKEGYTGKYI